MLRTPSLERVETSRNVTELIPWSFPHTSGRLTLLGPTPLPGEYPEWASCWAMRSSSLPDASRSGCEPVSWSRSGLSGGDLLHALLWAGRLPPAAFQGQVVPMGKVPEPGTPGEGRPHGGLSSLYPVGMRAEGTVGSWEPVLSSPNEHVRLNHSVLVLIKDGTTEVSKMQ